MGKGHGQVGKLYGYSDHTRRIKNWHCDYEGGSEISWPIWEISFSNSMKSEWEILQIVFREEVSLVAVLGEILKKL